MGKLLIFPLLDRLVVNVQFSIECKEKVIA